MGKVLIVLIVFFCVFLAIGCAGNKTGTPNQTGTTEAAASISEAKNAREKQNATEMWNAAKTLNATETQNTTGVQSAASTLTIKEFTLEELAQYNGKNGKSYVAYQGKVYDVSGSYLWVNGAHKGHKAGQDLTGELNRSPHGPKVIYGYPVVGTLKQ